MATRTMAIWLMGVVVAGAMMRGGERVVKAGELAPSVVWTLDVRELAKVNTRRPEEARRSWDTMHLLAALEGLVNRDAPRFYLFHCESFGVDTDRFWLDWYRGEDGWMKGAEVRPLAGWEAAVEQFREAFDGLVVYDERVPATSNLASTAAGVERLLPVRWDAAPESVYGRLTGRLKVPVKLWLVESDGSPRFRGAGRVPDTGEESSGSAKVDAYRWAMARWGKGTALGRGVGAYYIDAAWLRRADRAGADMHTLANHDWFIARRAFFFDLAPWGDEAPVDDPGQAVGADRACLLDVLRMLGERVRGEAAGGRMVKVGGFPPWPFKYTSHGGAGRHEPVATEWEFTRLISQFNAYHEADAAGLGAMANASFHAHYPLRESYPQPNAGGAVERLRARGLLGADGKVAPKFYVGHYVGDYDAPSWLYKAVPAFFRDTALGEVPLGWAFDPNLADRAPQAMVYARRRATTNDWFIAGDSGAGYLNPRGLTVRPDSGWEPALDEWVAYCTPRYRRWGLSITGFLLDGTAGASTASEYRAFGKFSPDGLGTHFERGPGMRAGVATCPERDLPDDVAAAAAVVLGRARSSARTDPGRPGFFWARSILKGPAWYAALSRRLRESEGSAVEVVDPYAFFELIRRVEGGR